MSHVNNTLTRICLKIVLNSALALKILSAQNPDFLNLRHLQKYLSKFDVNQYRTDFNMVSARKLYVCNFIQGSL